MQGSSTTSGPVSGPPSSSSSSAEHWNEQHDWACPAGEDCSGPWPQEFNGPFDTWLDVTRFGAVGDGMADDTVAFKQALAALLVDTRSVLYVPAGTYRITDTLTFASLEETYNPNHKAVLGKAILGHDPTDTTLLWDGPAGGSILHLAGQAHSRYGRLTFDGNNKARIGIQVERHSLLNLYSTYVRIHDCVFRGSEYGIFNTDINNGHEMDAEYQIVRCRFIGHDGAGIRIDAGNAYDYWVRHSRFEGCDRGIWNRFGDFYAMQNIFIGSRTADMEIVGHRAGGFRGNFSKGSRRFATVIGANVLFQANRIVAPQTSPAIHFDGGPHGTFQALVLLDNQLLWEGAPADAVLATVVQQKTPPVVAIGNSTAGLEPTVAEAVELIAVDNHRVDATAMDATEPLLPATPPMVQRPVFYAASAAELQARVDEAAAHARANPGSRPLIHLAPMAALLENTVVFPPDLPLTLVGDGPASRITWGGAPSSVKPALLLRGPSRITIQDIAFEHGRKVPNQPHTLFRVPVADIIIDNADQPGSRVISDNSWLSGVFADRLENTRIDLIDHYAAAYGDWLEVTLKSVGPPSGRGTSRIAMFGGVAIGDSVFAHVVDGGRVLMRDFWHEENSPMQNPWALLEGTGARPGGFVLQTAFLFKHPSGPMFEQIGFGGRVVALANYIYDSINKMSVMPPVAGSHLLSLVGKMGLERYSATPATMRLLDVRGSAISPDDYPWLRDQLEWLRGADSEIAPAPRPQGVTDVRLDRVVALYQNGWGVWIKPEPHTLDAVGVAVSAGQHAAYEYQEQPGTFVLVRDAWEDELTVNYQLEGTATAADYYQPAEGTISFAAGQRRVEWTLTPVDDVEQDDHEFVRMRLLPGNGYVVGAPRQGQRDRIILRSNDTDQAVAVATHDAVLTEDKRAGLEDNGFVVIERFDNIGELTVNLSWGGTAVAADLEQELPPTVTFPDGVHTVRIDLSMVADGEWEGTETLDLQLAPGAGYRLMDPQGVEFVLHDRDRIEIQVSAEIVGSVAATFTVSRNGTAGDLPVRYAMVDASGAHIQTVATATIPNGARSVDVPVPEEVLATSERPWLVQILPLPHAAHAVLPIPEHVGRYWWLVGTDRLATLDLHATTWGESRNAPGQPVIVHELVVPAEVRNDPAWTMPTNPERVDLAYDPVDDVLWVQMDHERANNGEPPQSLWRITGARSGNGQFHKWAQRNKSGYYPFSTNITLMHNRDVLMQFGDGSAAMLQAVVSRQEPMGVLDGQMTTHWDFGGLTPLADGRIMAGVQSNVIVWSSSADFPAVERGTVVTSGYLTYRTLVPVPWGVEQTHDLHKAIIVPRQYSTVELHHAGGNVETLGDLYTAYVGNANAHSWDPEGRLWLVPDENHSPGAVLDPGNAFHSVRYVSEIGYVSRLSFDNHYVYISRDSKNLTRESHDGGKQHFVSVGSDWTLGYTDPTGYRWYRLTQEPPNPSAPLTLAAGHP